MGNPPPKNILIAPLDWGAGHTTRCMPLISYLAAQGHNPIFAGNSAQLAIITEAFGSAVKTVQLDGYGITYTALNRIAQAGLLLQVPRVARLIKQEHRWLDQAVRQHTIHGIISDNRYGLWHAAVPSVIMTHQLRVQSGMGAAADAIVQRLHYRMLGRFSATWVVDTQGAGALAGSLSQPAQLPPHASYIGLLSRFAGHGHTARQAAAGKLLVLLSGPEPQRSILSGILWRQVLSYSGEVIFADGSSSAQPPAYVPPHITYHSRLGGEALLEAMGSAKLVVCRSGYSTVMDLAATGNRAILIPTPGQTEQMYLGRKLHGQGMHYCAPQQGFNLQRVLQECQFFPFRQDVLPPAFEQYKKVLDGWVSGL